MSFCEGGGCPGFRIYRLTVLRIRFRGEGPFYRRSKTKELEKNPGSQIEIYKSQPTCKVQDFILRYERYF